MKHIGSIALALISLTIALIGAEIGYRAYLSRQLHAAAEAQVQPSASPSFSYFADPPPWQYDEASGFRYTAEPWLSGKVIDGAFDHCNMSNAGNRYGNFGELAGNYEEAELKILILGSSYTMVRDAKGKQVKNLLQERLSQHLGKSVSILDYSRDATGLLTSFDIAQAKIKELSPDLLLFLFNVTALAYQRHWRVVEPIDQGFWRLVFSLDPVTSMGGAARADIQPHVISNLVTKPWCDAMTEARQRADTNALKSDPVVKRMIEMHHRILRDISKPIFAVDYGAFGKSFILNFVLHGDPYYKVQKFKERTVYGAHGYESLREDVQLETAINAVNRSGTPFLLVHLPTLLEMRAGGQFVHGMTGTPEERERKLAASLEQVTGKKVIHLYDYYDSEVRADPLRLVYSEHDSHPSPTGVKAMAKALEQMLMRIPETSEMFGNARRVQ